MDFFFTPSLSNTSETVFQFSLTPKDKNLSCPQSTEQEETHQTDRNNKGSSKKGRRRRKRGKVRREIPMDAENVDYKTLDDIPCDNQASIKNKKMENNLYTSQKKSDINLLSDLKDRTSKKNLCKLLKSDNNSESCSKNSSNISWLDSFDDSKTDSEIFIFEEDTTEQNASFKEKKCKNQQVNKKQNAYSKSVNSKKGKSGVSWLDADDSEDDNDNMEDLNCNSLNLKDDNVLNSTQNKNLNAYKQRFFLANEKKSLECNTSNSAPTTSHIWNNEKVVIKDNNSKIGVNVNDWNRISNKKKDKYDGTKRSRRKTEPFDFAQQAEGEVKDLPKSPNALLNVINSNFSSWDIPSGLCNFMADGNDNTTKSLDGRNLLSGSISGKGLFVPFENFNNNLSREGSLERIFDEDYCEDTDDLMSDSNSDAGRSESEDEEDRRGESLYGALPPEPQLGNIEYKLKLVNPTKQRFEHLVTQMKWRLREGQGEALYEIGVRDCGRVRGLAPTEMRASLRTLRRMATRLGAACTLLGRRRLPDTRRALAEVLVRKVPDDQHNIEVRVAVMGSNDAGKSTLVGVLTQGELDNGRGSARLNMFRHLHEVKTGRTSSVSHEILGFDSQGRAINYAYSELMTSEEINERSSKLVSFIDLAGHRKYLKTTVQGLTGYSPHYAMLVVSATAGVTQMTLEHLALLVALDSPFFVVITKVDATSPDQIIKQLECELKSIGCRKVPFSVLTMDDAVIAGSSAPFRLVVPVLPVSSVTGKGLDVLRWFLFLAPPVTTPAKLEQDPVEFQVDETFKIGDASGPVVGGLLKKGILSEKTKLLIGPLDTGDFVPIYVNSLHRNKAPCRVVRAGQAASLGLSWLPPGLRQGMFLLAIPDNYSVQEENLQNLTKNISKMRKKDKIKHPDSIQVSPKFSKKTRRKIEFENRNNCPENNKKVNVDPDDKRNEIVSICNEEIDKFVKDASEKEVKSSGINFKEINTRDQKTSIRLSPSRYTSRFTNVFPSTSVHTLPIIDNEESGESLSSEDDLPKEVETCECSIDLKETSGDAFNDILLEEDPNDPLGCYFFQATVSLLNHSAAIYPGTQSTVHIENIRQTAVIEGILSSDNALRANEQAPVLFRFVRHPEYVRTGARILFREALHTKGVGRITQVFPHREYFKTTYCSKHNQANI